MSMIFRKRPKWLRFCTVIAVLLATSAAPAIGLKQKGPIPNVDFEVAAKRVDHGATGNGVHIFRLYCGLGACELEQLSLNECENTSVGLAFTPKLHRWTTAAGNLEIQLMDDNILEVKVFQGTHKMLPALLRLTFRPELPLAKRVTGFKASGFMDYSKKERGVRTPAEFAAFPDSVQTIRMDCPILLRGLEKE